tara:strand:- start:148296 stop:148862 length:567 start_codon:yes stop_codon:yes gene_type:complete
MFETDALHKRGKALEDEFFHRVDEELRAKIRQQVQRETTRETLAALTGFTDDDLLDHLVEANFEASTIAALALVPLVWVAWADGKVTPKERQAVIHASLKRGLENQPTALHLVEEWMAKRPPDSLWDLWVEYARAIDDSLSPATAKMLSTVILNQATAVATAAGTRLGRNKISEPERKILDEIAACIG